MRHFMFALLLPVLMCAALLMPTALLAQAYAPPVFTGPSDDFYIDNVELKMLKHYDSGGSTLPADGYKDYAATLGMVLARGVRYSGISTLARIGAPGNAQLKYWIDYNQDGVFQDTQAEWINEGFDWEEGDYGFYPAAGRITCNFTVPASAPLGLTRLRGVYCQRPATGFYRPGPYSAIVSAQGATKDYDEGECHDYWVLITDGGFAITNPIPPATALPDASEGIPYAFNFGFVHEIPGLTATWTLLSAPAWLSLDASSGALTGTPPAGTSGTQVTLHVRADAGVHDDERTLTLNISAGPGPLPFEDDFEAGIATSDYLIGGGGLSRALATTEAAAGASALGLQLDTAPNGTGWPLTTSTGPAIADAPAQWDANAPDHAGSLIFAVDAAGVFGCEVAFDYFIENVNATGKEWYANFAFEYSTDSGQTWIPASGTGADPATNVYRDDTGGTFRNTSFSIFGLPGSGIVAFRFHWLMKFSREDGFVATWAAIDNLSITDATAGAPLAITTRATLPGAIEARSYTAQVTAAGGTQPYTWVLTGHPAWLSIGATSGVLAGIPPAGSSGSISFGITVTDQSQPQESDTLAATLDIDPAPPVALAISTTTLPNGFEGSQYLAPLDAVGGTLPYVWAFVSGSMPQGMGVDSSGELAGVPTIGAAGVHQMTFQVMDSTLTTDTATLTLTITPVIDGSTIEVPSLKSGGGGCSVLAGQRDWLAAALALVLLALASHGRRRTLGRA